MEHVKQTLEQVSEGLNAHCEQDILPIYCDGQLANGAAYTACRFKRFAITAGRFTTEAAHNTAQAATRAAELTGQYLTYMANYNG
jgi:hypothetical protein